MNLGGRQVRIVHHDLRCAVAMCDVIRNNIDNPVSGSVYAGTTPSIESDVGINDVFRLVCSHGTLLLRLMIRKLARWLQERKRASQEDDLGEMTVNVTLENPIDRGVFERGDGEESAIRQEERPVAGPLTIRIGNRFMSTDCVVGPPLSEPLIGQIVLEALDLIADCTNRTLSPRPESPDYPLLKLK